MHRRDWVGPGKFIIFRRRILQKTIGNVPEKISAWPFHNYVMVVMIARKVPMSTMTYVPKIFAGMSLTDGSAQEIQRYSKTKTINETILLY